MSEITEIKNEPGAVNMPEKPYAFRRLNATDTFLMFKIIGKIGVNEIAACLESDGIKRMIGHFAAGNVAGDNITIAGIAAAMEIANVIFNNLPKCENEIFALLANVSNMNESEIRAMEFAPFSEMVIDFVRKEEFADFISVVSRQFK